MATLILSQYDKADKVISNTINIEGGYSNNPKDSGGATKFGITLATYQLYVNKNATARDLAAISSNEAKQFYRQHFFYKNNIDKLPEPVWDIVFDMTVNHGPSNTFKMVQLALVKLGQQTPITGTNDARTIFDASKVEPQALRYAIISQRVYFYNVIISHKPSQKIFSAGWFRRCGGFVNTNVLS